MPFRVRSIAPPATTAAAPRPGPDALAAAAGIGERLVREAVWYRAQCNWVGIERDSEDGGERRQAVHCSLGPALADGTAGVALFLAQLHAATGDGAVRRTALGAIAQALGQIDQVPASAARGLYDGRIGIAYAAARCGLLLGDEPLLRRAAQIARGRWASSADTAERADLSGGSAGAVAGLLALARLLDDERLVARAARLGDELVRTARRGREGWSWAPPAASRPAQPAPGPHKSGRDANWHGLCGLAQGASGPATALLELFAISAERRYREAAEQALRYERHWFDPGEGNWPDLRGIERRERRGSFRPPYVTAWSHGAPGIALARLRAWQLLGDDEHRDEAAVALATTAASVERELLAHGADFTLRDGLAGSADVLLLGAAALSDGASPHAALARRAGEIGIGRYAASVDGWPAGAAGGAPPGLLGGHAGIGLFYLRLHDRTVPSALLVVAGA